MFGPTDGDNPDVREMLKKEATKVATAWLDVADNAEKGNWVRCAAQIQILLNQAIGPYFNSVNLLMVHEGSGEPFDPANAFPSMLNQDNGQHPQP